MLSAILLSFNRRDALRRTLVELARLEPIRGGEVVVVDNASTDGSPAMVRTEFPWARVIALEENVGVEGFNVGAREATGDVLLILDDDAWPAPGALERALAILDGSARIAAVTLSPVHPATKRPEWPFLRAATDRWPAMGCGNVVRASAWREMGGYQREYFLYRNDTDLALTLLAAGHGVHADPGLVVWHDSPAATRKGERWLELATRNWCWMGRRHGRGATRIGGIAAGVAWACVQAGAHARRLACVARGAWSGLASRAPGLPEGVRPDGGAYRDLMRLRRRGRA